METTRPATHQQEGFGALLKRHRVTAGLSQAELAERARLSVRAISAYERGQRQAPYRDTVALLAQALGLSPEEATALEAAVPRRHGPEAARHPATAASSSHVTETARTNLPLALTSFVGRDQELATVRGALGQTRLLTLTGVGGCGKTRLALEVARALAREAPAPAGYADGIWLVELAALGDAGLVPRDVATILGVRERANQRLLTSLADYLRPMQLLLLLDNCEHLLAACAELADALLRVCSRLTILATSREPLSIGGELPWRVPSLGLPDAGRLFVQRAQVVRPEFAPTGEQASLVAQVCRRLDGIPLAIELAATRLSALALDQLSARLDDRFRLLTGGSRTALPRQQTLRATLEWSHDLLGGPERLLLRRLSVFAGGWTLEAAEAICAGDGISPEEVLDLLAGLVGKSLVQAAEVAGGGMRYSLLETVRQYGREKLAEVGEVALLQDRHLDWFLALAGQAALGMGGAEREVWLARLADELENLRAALGWSSREEGRQEAGLRLAAALEDFWYMRGYAGEGRRWLEDLLARGSSAPAAVRARALDVLALLTSQQGDSAHAMALFEEAYALHRSEGNAQGASWALTHQAAVAIHLGAYQRATTLLERVLPAHRERGDQHGVGWTLNYLASIQQLQGDYARAAALSEESLAVFQGLGDTFGISALLSNLARLARERCDYGQARRLYRESLHVHRALRAKPGFAACFEGLAVVAAAEGQPVRAARLFAAAQCLRDALGRAVDLGDRTSHDRTVADVRATLGEDAFTAARSAGEAMGLEVAIAEALDDPGHA